MSDTSIDIDKFLDEREVDAALYLLKRMLDLPDERLGEHRDRLTRLRNRVKRRRRLVGDEERQVLDAYNDLIR